MYLIFEYCFYAGVLLTIIGMILLVKALMGGNWRRLGMPVGILLLGIVLAVGPGVISQMMVVDLGPRDTIVNAERHYQFLSSKRDVVVLQMDNRAVSCVAVSSKVLAGAPYRDTWRANDWE